MNVVTFTSVDMSFSRNFCGNICEFLSWFTQKIKLQGTGCITAVRTASNRKTDSPVHNTDI